MRPTRGDFAALYARSARSPKRIFLPRRHAFKGLATALTATLVVAGTVTALTRVDVGAMTIAAGAGSAEPSGSPSPRRSPAAGERPGAAEPSPTPSGSPSPVPSGDRSFEPVATATAQPPASPPPSPSPTAPRDTATASPAPERADFFSVETSQQGTLNPDSSFAELWVTNTKPISDLRLEIRLIQTGGVRNLGTYAGTRESGQNVAVPAGDITVSVKQTSGALVYLFELNDGATLQPGTWQLQGSYSYTGGESGRYTGGDSYSVTGTNPASGAVDSAKGQFD